ncbi:MDR family NADP-dependent oxidoreductase [Chelatococcus reniformis]|uniref:NADP-dependent oxidoreductase n=1 Tax=Chelatococcus reniformis TaxID=1494448 RepID=A0A916XBM1_9HYPH|nr:NADP-dependent oxidoreductase [Chelatococcus reniformis]GGC59909.1 NADP-dependent oxidoreductase [Chelatococcus reniformis]
MSETYRQWIFAKPMVDDVLGPEQFELRERPIPDLAPNQALVRVRLINIHSATRSRMATGMTRLGDTDLSNYACAQVIRSRDPAFREGDTIACQAGWQDHQVISSLDASVGYGTPNDGVKALNRTNSQWCYALRPEMVRAWPAEVLMDMFGTSGMTAYFGMRQCGPLKPGEQVAVAGASGSVGSIVAQLARIAGCRVIGFAGGADRCRWVVDTLGIDGCIDYRGEDFAERLQAAFPGGIDVFSDGIGGELTATVTGRMNRGGRLLAYGGAGGYYADRLDRPQQRPSLRRMFGISETVEATIAARELRAEAWIVDAFYAERLTAEDDLASLMRSGQLKPISHVVDGFDNLPTAIVDLYRTPHAGKLQVRFEA